MALSIYNTLSRKLEPFQTAEEGRVRMYVCGPTVYADAHIGHAMSAIVFDMIRRYLEYIGYEVTYVTNFTDVDDKIIVRAKETGQDPFQLAQFYTDKYLMHLSDLNIKPADSYPRVTNEISNIIRTIGELGETNYAYEMDGSVYFRVQNDDDYGKLSRRRQEDAVAGTRVDSDERKENAADFALWKAAKAGEPSWESPWGPGRPGWHIECSVMCLHHLGETIDIHGGGNDLIFPHHENEIAQSESLTGKPFARYWVHNGMLQLSGEKMSKSVGNLVTIDEFLQRYSADALRLLVFTAHYRKPVAYTEESIAAAERSAARLRGGLRPASGTVTVGESAENLRETAEAARSGFRVAMDDDLNTSAALAQLFELVRAINSARAAGVSGPFFQAAQETLRELAGVLGLSLSDAGESQGDSLAAKEFIDLLVSLRTELRQEKQWALADKVREGLASLSVYLEDTPDGTVWRFEDAG
ncbi:MAG: cysteine--tRNA ligase [Caldilineaceae bacterium]|nr:cysteine--tRNA ligase [Caldilineaceae bacterium]MCY4116834.1 cysteine--tRNA ligase [Caldilineaceae bacterium]